MFIRKRKRKKRSKALQQIFHLPNRFLIILDFCLWLIYLSIIRWIPNARWNIVERLAVYSPRLLVLSSFSFLSSCPFIPHLISQPFSSFSSTQTKIDFSILTFHSSSRSPTTTLREITLLSEKFSFAWRRGKLEENRGKFNRLVPSVRVW